MDYNSITLFLQIFAPFQVIRAPPSRVDTKISATAKYDTSAEDAKFNKFIQEKYLHSSERQSSPIARRTILATYYQAGASKRRAEPRRPLYSSSSSLGVEEPNRLENWVARQMSADSDLVDSDTFEQGSQNVSSRMARVGRLRKRMGSSPGTSPNREDRDRSSSVTSQGSDSDWMMRRIPLNIEGGAHLNGPGRMDSPPAPVRELDVNEVTVTEDMSVSLIQQEAEKKNIRVIDVKVEDDAGTPSKARESAGESSRMILNAENEKYDIHESNQDNEGAYVAKINVGGDIKSIIAGTTSEAMEELNKMTATSRERRHSASSNSSGSTFLATYDVQAATESSQAPSRGAASDVRQDSKAQSERRGEIRVKSQAHASSPASTKTTYAAKQEVYGASYSTTDNMGSTSPNVDYQKRLDHMAYVDGKSAQSSTPAVKSEAKQTSVIRSVVKSQSSSRPTSESSNFQDELQAILKARAASSSTKEDVEMSEQQGDNRGEYVVTRTTTTTQTKGGQLPQSSRRQADEDDAEVFVTTTTTEKTVTRGSATQPESRERTGSVNSLRQLMAQSSKSHAAEATAQSTSTIVTKEVVTDRKIISEGAEGRGASNRAASSKSGASSASHAVSAEVSGRQVAQGDSRTPGAFLMRSGSDVGRNDQISFDPSSAAGNPNFILKKRDHSEEEHAGGERVRRISKPKKTEKADEGRVSVTSSEFWRSSTHSDASSHMTKDGVHEMSLPRTEFQEYPIENIDDSITQLDAYLKTQYDDTVSVSSRGSSRIEKFSYGVKAPFDNTQF